MRGEAKRERGTRTGIVGRSDLAFLYVGKKVVDDVVVGALTAKGRDELGLVGIP